MRLGSSQDRRAMSSLLWSLGVWVNVIVGGGWGWGGGVDAAVTIPGMNKVCSHNQASAYSPGKPPNIDTPLYTLHINQTKYVPGQPILGKFLLYKALKGDSNKTLCTDTMNMICSILIAA